MKYLLAFGSTHKCLKAEKLLKETDRPFRLLPAPKKLTTDCDLLISIEEELLPGVIGLLEENILAPKNIYKEENGEYVKV
jgi:hypothetical protein